jgi:hypothetical protein
MASRSSGGDDRDELAQGLPATGMGPIGGDAPDLPRPLGDRATEAATGRPATTRPLDDRAKESRLHRSGSKLLLIGGILFAIGLVIALIAEGLPNGIGVAFMALAVPPTLAGAAMELAALVERRSRRGRSFA